MKVILDHKQIDARIERLAREISYAYASDNKLVVLIVLNGGYMFGSDLVKNLYRDCYVEFTKAASYGHQFVSSGKPAIQDLFTSEVKPILPMSHVLIVEDIVDTGTTVVKLKQHIQGTYSPKSVRIASLLYKPQSVIKPDFYGFEIPNDSFAVGRGLDYKGLFRNLINVYNYNVEDDR